MLASTTATSSATGNGSVAIGARSMLAPTASASVDPPSSPVPISQEPFAPVSASDPHEHDPYDPMVHTDTSDMLEDSLDIPTDCALLVDIDGIIQTNGEDLVHGAIDEAADSLIREVSVSVLGCTPLSVGADAAVAPTTTAAMLTASPVASGLSRSALACALPTTHAGFA
ncbi:hypothetical protein V6N13_090920 [Hibiscus sabdariffa]